MTGDVLEHRPAQTSPDQYSTESRDGCCLFLYRLQEVSERCASSTCGDVARCVQRVRYWTWNWWDHIKTSKYNENVNNATLKQYILFTYFWLPACKSLLLASDADLWHVFCFRVIRKIWRFFMWVVAVMIYKGFITRGPEKYITHCTLWEYVKYDVSLQNRNTTGQWRLWGF